MELDHEMLGLKAGLEIHQQLDTSKLFCNCPSFLRQDEPDFIIKRKLHAVAGESGVVDEAAAYEAAKEKEFVYEGYRDTTCLVELDDEPPHPINSEALKTVLHIALLMNCKIFPISQIMRKTVIDGSNTSGFQRTVLIARDGWIETSLGRVGIDTICLEEDSARIVSKSGEGDKGRGENVSVFRLDRLGIPLVEIVTAPDIKTPEQAKETALLIGNILRSCKVRRGIGTIRQDINISIKPKSAKERSNRVELKGFQDPRIMIKTVETEAERQGTILEKGGKNSSEVRNVLPNGESKFLRPMPGASRMYPETDLPLLRISKEMINDAKKTLPKSNVEVEKELAGKGLNKDMIKMLLGEGKMEEFRELLEVSNNPSLVAKLLLIFPKEIMAKNKLSQDKIEERINGDAIAGILEEVKKGRIEENAIKGVLERIALGESMEKIISSERADLNEVEDKVRKLIKEKPGLSSQAYMGIVMAEFKGRANGKEVMEIIKRYIK